MIGSEKRGTEKVAYIVINKVLVLCQKATHCCDNMSRRDTRRDGAVLCSSKMREYRGRYPGPWIYNLTSLTHSFVLKTLEQFSLKNSLYTSASMIGNLALHITIYASFNTAKSL